MQIKIYGKPNCVHCDRAKLHLDRKGWKYSYFNLFDMEPKDAQAIKDRSAMRSVPMVEIDGQFIGGADALEGFIRGVEERKV